MSDKPNNLNQNNENISFDEGKQDPSSEPNQQAPANKATAPLNELPDTEDGHLAETVKSESSVPHTGALESSASPNDDNKDDGAKPVQVIKPLKPKEPEKSLEPESKADENPSPMMSTESAKPEEPKIVTFATPSQEPEKVDGAEKKTGILSPEEPNKVDSAEKKTASLAPADESEKSEEPKIVTFATPSQEPEKVDGAQKKTDTLSPEEPEKMTGAEKKTASLAPSDESEKSEEPKIVTFAMPSQEPEKVDGAEKKTGTLSEESETSEEPETTASSPDSIKFTNTNNEEDEAPATIHSRRSIFGDKDDEQSFLTFKTKKEDPTPHKNPDTAVLSEKSAVWRKVIDSQVKGTTSSLGEQREVLFVIRGMIERVVMKDSSTVTLGRFDTGTVPNEEIDLIPYGAIDRGVSRRHCKIQLQENQLHVIDLQSTNGTFLAGVRLRPNEATVLRKGDELLLGRLAVQVLFR